MSLSRRSLDSLSIGRVELIRFSSTDNASTDDNDLHLYFLDDASIRCSQIDVYHCLFSWLCFHRQWIDRQFPSAMLVRDLAIQQATL